MKKLTMLLLAATIGTAAFAQLSYGVQLTGNLASASIKEGDMQLPGKTARVLPGAGFTAQYPLSDKFALRGGIGFLQQGVVVKSEENGTAGEINSIRYKTTVGLNYIQLPVNAVYATQFRSARLYAGAGGFAGLGIGGKIKSETTIDFTAGGKEVSKEETDAFKKAEDGGAGLKRFDFGIGALAGLQLSNGLFVQAGYQLGLANIAADETSKYSNRGLHLTIGYFFKSK